MSWRRFAAPVTVSAALLLGLAGLIAACQPASRTSQPTTQSSRPAQTLPIRVEEMRQTADDQPIRGWVARIDLADPRVAVRVTGPIERRPDDPPGIEARTQTTLDWLKREGLALAVNTHFFARLDDGKGPVPTSAPVDLIGPCVSGGRVVSPGRGDGRPSPVLALTRERRARIALLTSGELDGVDDVVSGLPETGGRSGGLLVEHGANTGASALPRPLERHPRTAAGLTADGRTLILVVIDGRQPAWSIGLTLPELADLMLKLGAESAVNLDGGGSSSFIFAPPDGPQVTNRPSDGRWRPVGASLGVYLKPQP